MKTIEELALGTVDVAVITPKVIAKAIEEIARGERVFAQFFRENRDLVGPGKPHEIVFPKKQTGISATWDVPPGGTVAATKMSYDATTIRVKKGGIRLEFTNEALESAMRDVIKDHIYEAGLVWAELIDDIAKTVMLDIRLGTVTFTAAAGKISETVPSTMAPILEIVSVTGNTLDRVDYYDGELYFAGTAPSSTIVFTYAYRPNSNTMTVSVQSAGTLSAWDMLAARNKIISHNRHPDVFIMNDADLPGLLYDNKVKFLDVSAYGGREPLLNAEIGKIFGLKIVTTTRAPEGAGICIDSSRLGYDVHKRDLRGYREDKYEYDSVWYHFWAERGFGVTDDLAVALVVGAKTGDYKATIS